MKDKLSTHEVKISGDGNVMGENNVVQVVKTKGDVIYQIFSQAPGLSHYIRVRQFQSLVNERTQGFVGRDFIFRAICNLVRSPDFPSGYIIIHGEPGIGKTSLMAQLIKKQGYLHHFNIASQNIRSARDFLGNLCAQIIAVFKLDYATLPPEAIQDSGFLSQLIQEASARLKDIPLIILIDALDEAEHFGLSSNANCLYLPQSLPKNVFFVVTTRERVDYRLFVDRRQDIYLRDDDLDNLKDIREYVRNFINENQTQMTMRIAEWGLAEGEFVEVITSKSQGNFMYLVHVLRDIQNGKFTPKNMENIHNLPKGLYAYYQRHWRLMRKQDIDRFEKYYEPVVCILATVREPVSIAKVVEWTKLKPMAVKRVIQDWREFLNLERAEDGTFLYRIYHASFQDFLKDEVGLVDYHHTIAQQALDKIKW